MKNRSRVNPAAEPHAQGNVRDEVLTNSILHQGIELFFGGLQRVRIRNTERQRPIGAGRDLTVAPLEPAARREFFDALDQLPIQAGVLSRLRREFGR